MSSSQLPSSSSSSSSSSSPNKQSQSLKRHRSTIKISIRKKKTHKSNCIVTKKITHHDSNTSIHKNIGSGPPMSCMNMYTNNSQSHRQSFGMDATTPITRTSTNTSNMSIPSILTRKYNDDTKPKSQYLNECIKRSKRIDSPKINSNKQHDHNDFQDDESFAKMLEEYVDETPSEDLNEIILAIKSLIRRHAAAICPLLMLPSTKDKEAKTNLHNNYDSLDYGGDDNSIIMSSCRSYLPFVLKPMVKVSLQSKSSSSTRSRSSSNSWNGDANCKISSLKTSPSSLFVKEQNSHQIASAYIATGFDLELEELDIKNKVRLLQLHGMTTIMSTTNEDDEGWNTNSVNMLCSSHSGGSCNDDENVAIMLMNDYICGVYDAASYTCMSNTAAAVHDNNKGAAEASNNTTNIQPPDVNNDKTFQENEVIIKLFLDCIHFHGCNGLFVTTTKLSNAFKAAWDIYKAGTKTRFPVKSFHTMSSSTPSSLSSSRDINIPSSYQPQKWIESLVHMQLLLPRVIHNSQISCTTSYWYTLPKLGMAARVIMEGRRRMISRIKRSYNKELRWSVLESMNINMKSHHLNAKSNKSSEPQMKSLNSLAGIVIGGGKKMPNMSGSFHLRDLLSIEVVKVVQRPSGPFIKFK